MQKGCLIEVSEEVDQYADFINSLISPKPNLSLVKRVASELVAAHIDALLDSKLSHIFRHGFDIYETFLNVIKIFDHDELDKTDLEDLSNFLQDLGVELFKRLKDMFHDVETSYALWHLKPVNATVVLVEYLGDFRIMEWHERSGIAYNKTDNDVKYEFEISPVTKLIKSLLEQHRGRYAGKIFNRTITHITGVVIEEFVFLGNSLKLTETIMDIRATEYPITRSKLKEFFPLLEPEQVTSFIVDVDQAVEEYIKKPIQLITPLDDVNVWFISDNILTIQVDKPLTPVDFGERIKNEIRASIANGDWVPPKLRELVGHY